MGMEFLLAGFLAWFGSGAIAGIAASSASLASAAAANKQAEYMAALNKQKAPQNDEN